MCTLLLPCVFVVHYLIRSILPKKKGFHSFGSSSFFYVRWNLRTWESIAHSAVRRISFRWNVGVATSTFACSIFVRKTINVKWQIITTVLLLFAENADNP